jgi:hypothetical protein
VLDSSSRILKSYTDQADPPMNITEFEQRVIEQKPVESGHYDSEYFTGDWRAEGNNYNLERAPDRGEESVADQGRVPAEESARPRMRGPAR